MAFNPCRKHENCEFLAYFSSDNIIAALMGLN